MDKNDTSKIRACLGRTQSQMAQLLGVSLKTIQRFEQGWRNIPVHIERQVLFLLAMKGAHKRNTPCWVLQKCPSERRESCPAWEFECGDLCWFINGTICQGEIQESWHDKMKMCRNCEVFRSAFSFL